MRNISKDFEKRLKSTEFSWEKTLKELERWIEQQLTYREGLSKSSWESFFKARTEDQQEIWAIAVNPSVPIPFEFSDGVSKAIISEIREYLGSKRELHERAFLENEESEYLPNFQPKFISESYQEQSRTQPQNCSFCNNSADKFICSVCFNEVNKLKSVNSRLQNTNTRFRQKLTNWIQLLTVHHA